jgi:hypothetical protein
MLRLAFGIWLKDRITIADKVMVFIYSYRAKHAKSRRERNAYLKQIVRVITGKRFVWLRDFLYLNKMLDACGMLKKGKEETRTIDQMKDAVVNLCSEIGSRCGKTPHEIMTSMTDREIEIFSLHLYLRYYENALNRAAAQASPSGFGDIMERKISETHSKIQNIGQPVTVETVKNDLSVNSMFKGMFG